MGRTPKLLSKSKQNSKQLSSSQTNVSNNSNEFSSSIQRQVTDFYPVTRGRGFATRNKQKDLSNLSISPYKTISTISASDQSSKPNVDSDGFAVPFPITVSGNSGESNQSATFSTRSISEPPASHSSTTPTNPSSRSSSRSATPATPTKRHALTSEHEEASSTPSHLKRLKECSTEPSRNSSSTESSSLISSSLPSTPSAPNTNRENRQPSLKGAPAARRRLVLTSPPEESSVIAPLPLLNTIAETTPFLEKPFPPDSTLPSPDLLPSDEFLHTTRASQTPRETRALSMPRHYAEVLDNMESTDRVLSLMFNRKQTCTFSRLKSGVQQVTRRYIYT